MSKDCNTLDRLSDFFPIQNNSDKVLSQMAKFYSDNMDHAERMLSYFKSSFFLPSTPILTTVPFENDQYKGAPISCFLNEVTPDNYMEILYETMHIAKSGGGLGTVWSSYPSSLENTDHKSNGVIPLMAVQCKLMSLCFGVARFKGSVAVFLDVDHGDIENFIDIRKNVQGLDPDQQVPRYIHHGVVISDAFMEAVIGDKTWNLVGTKKQVLKTISARKLFKHIISTRLETGEPYILFKDNANRTLPSYLKELGLSIKTTNLCTEIVLPTGKDYLGVERTAICCLGSVNVENFDKWKNIPEFFDDILRFYDNVLSRFIVDGCEKKYGSLEDYDGTYGWCVKLREREWECVQKAMRDKNPLRNAIWSAYHSRDIGIGACGVHSFMQSKELPYDSLLAKQLNAEVFSHMKEKIDMASKKLAKERGSCPDAKIKNVLERFAHKTAIAPTSTISDAMGTSKAIDPTGNVIVYKNVQGFHTQHNKILRKKLRSKDLDNMETWKDIVADNLNKYLSPEECALFKSASSWDPKALLDMAMDRNMDQSQSYNMYFTPPYDFSKIMDAHLYAWKIGMKTLYYLYGGAKMSASIGIQAKLEDLKGSKETKKSSVCVCVIDANNQLIKCFECQSLDRVSMEEHNICMGCDS